MLICTKTKQLYGIFPLWHEDGYRFIEPSEGFLACGYVGKGRLEEPEKIVELVVRRFASEKIFHLRGKKLSLRQVQLVNGLTLYGMFEFLKW